MDAGTRSTDIDAILAVLLSLFNSPIFIVRIIVRKTLFNTELSEPENDSSA